MGWIGLASVGPARSGPRHFKATLFGPAPDPEKKYWTRQDPTNHYTTERPYLV